MATSGDKVGVWSFLRFPVIGSLLWLVILAVWKANSQSLSWWRFVVLNLGVDGLLFLAGLLVFQIKSHQRVVASKGVVVFHDQAWCNKFLKDKYKREENLILESFTETASSFAGSHFVGETGERVYYQLYRERRVGSLRYVLGLINMEEGLEDMSGFFKVPMQEMPTVSEERFQKFISEKSEMLVKNKTRRQEDRLVVRNEVEGTERIVETSKPVSEENKDEEDEE